MRDGHDAVEFSWLRGEIAVRARRPSAGREGLGNPAQDWLSRVARAPRMAVVGVRLRDLDDLIALHGYVLEPAFRSGTPIVIESQERLSRLPPERFVDPEFEYPYTLERALDVATRLYRGCPEEAPDRRAMASGAVVPLDAEQRRAVDAHDGVVQVIAPAGSGKTTVLIERVRELRCRGVPAERILCTTFNRDARMELQERLGAAGLDSVTARTFHSLGLGLMREEGLTRSNGLRQLTMNQWKRMCALVAREDGTWIEPADARAAISDVKLGLLATPREFRRRAGERADGPALARIYELYEQHLTEQAINDYDDLVLRAVRALREDGELRQRWQGRFRQVLVDEYQDIEPAQELLVRILAAPQDGFFCVGDEDQTLYGWRRASVRRIIDLDLVYPGLQRISLAHNYRCPPEVVDAARRLIEHNQIRFPKTIQAQPGRPAGGPGALRLHEHDGQPQAAGEIARVLAGRRRGEAVVLARTTNLLRVVALACADLGVMISAPAAVFEPHGARGALEAHLRLCGAPGQAQPEDVGLVCREPNRGLPFETEGQVATLLGSGRTFTESLAGLPANSRQRFKLDDAGRVLDALARMADARRFIAYLRGPGGLDKHFAEYEETFGATERIELEILEEAQREASGKTVAEYGALLQARADALRGVRDDRGGIELTTIHRAKGRQWPEVHLFACEENQLPHRRSLDSGERERAAGEGIEAERRLAYVAFTRAQRALVITATETAASRFLTEAGLDPTHPYGGLFETVPEPGSKHRTATVRGPIADKVSEALRVGLGYALRTAPDRRIALDIAATAIEHGLIGPDTASQRTSVAELLDAIEQLDQTERTATLEAAEIADDEILVRRLGAGTGAQFARALRALASGPDVQARE